MLGSLSRRRVRKRLARALDRPELNDRCLGRRDLSSWPTQTIAGAGGGGGGRGRDLFGWRRFRLPEIDRRQRLRLTSGLRARRGPCHARSVAVCVCGAVPTRARACDRFMSHPPWIRLIHPGRARELRRSSASFARRRGRSAKAPAPFCLIAVDAAILSSASPSCCARVACCRSCSVELCIARRWWCSRSHRRGRRWPRGLADAPACHAAPSFLFLRCVTA